MPSKASVAGGGVAGGGIGAEAAFGGVSSGLAMAKSKAGDVLGGIFDGGVPWNMDPFEIVRSVGGAGDPGALVPMLLDVSAVVPA